MAICDLTKISISQNSWIQSAEVSAAKTFNNYLQNCACFFFFNFKFLFNSTWYLDDVHTVNLNYCSSIVKKKHIYRVQFKILFYFFVYYLEKYFTEKKAQDLGESRYNAAYLLSQNVGLQKLSCRGICFSIIDKFNALTSTCTGACSLQLLLWKFHRLTPWRRAYQSLSWQLLTL